MKPENPTQQEVLILSLETVLSRDPLPIFQLTILPFVSSTLVPPTENTRPGIFLHSEYTAELHCNL